MSQSGKVQKGELGAGLSKKVVEHSRPLQRQKMHGLFPFVSRIGSC